MSDDNEQAFLKRLKRKLRRDFHNALEDDEVTQLALCEDDVIISSQETPLKNDSVTQSVLHHQSAVNQMHNYGPPLNKPLLFPVERASTSHQDGCNVAFSDAQHLGLLSANSDAELDSTCQGELGVSSVPEHFPFKHSELVEAEHELYFTSSEDEDVEDLKESSSCCESNKLDSVSEEDDGSSLQQDLAEWALTNPSVSHTAIDQLLGVLRAHGLTALPKQASTLLKTSRNVSKSFVTLGSGTYWYRGLRNALGCNFHPDLASNHDGEMVVILDIFIDGISPYKAPSVKTALWPKADRIICESVDTKPFVIALWSGKKKEPDNLQEFLNPFVNECMTLMNGFDLNGTQYKLVVRNCIADAPARAWLKQVNPHNSKIYCERCWIRGTWIQNRITYQCTSSCKSRTDDNFRKRDDPQYHVGTSPLEKIMCMVSQFPLDRLHLIDLGATHRFLKMLYEPKASTVKLRGNLIKKIDDSWEQLHVFFPSDFGRKPKPLSQWKIYKGKELRRLLHYDGILLFSYLSLLDHSYSDVYDCFLLLSCAVRILSDSNLCSKFVDDADHLLRSFVEFGSKVFGSHFVVYNIHHLTHLADDCRLHGPLDNFCAYIYESSLGKMVKYLRAPGRALAQIAARTLERENMQTYVEDGKSDHAKFSFPCEESISLPGLQGEKYKMFKNKNFMFRALSLNDSCFLSRNKDVVVIEKIVNCKGTAYFVGRHFEEKSSFFTYPVESTVLGIYKVKKLSSSVSFWPIGEVTRKNVLLPINLDESKTMYLDGCLAIPLMHPEY